MAVRPVSLLVLALGLATPLEAHAQTFRAVDIGTEGAPRGYWEFLPSAHAADPARPLPVLFFFHGLGEGGNGTTELDRLLVSGPPKLLSTESHPLHGVFEMNEVIVLCPQLVHGTWWGAAHVGGFVDWALAHYPVDPSRIYMTGLSAGSNGVQAYMNDDPDAANLAAVLVVAVRGTVNAGEGDYLAPTVPFWALTAVADASSQPADSVNALAAYLLGAPSDVDVGYPGTSETHTALFSVSTGWTWVDGVDGSSGYSPKFTLYPPEVGHASWTPTYDNPDVWAWIFAQRRGGAPPADGGLGILDAGAPDAGVASDAGVVNDAATSTPADAGARSDAGAHLADGGVEPAPEGCSCAAAGVPGRAPWALGLTSAVGCLARMGRRGGRGTDRKARS